MTLYENIYRVETTRYKYHDYNGDGEYFITICTKDKVSYFGYIKNKAMCLNNVGKIVQKFWMEIPRHFDNVTLDQFIIMPNHVHGIIVICNDDSRDVALQRLNHPKTHAVGRDVVPKRLNHPKTHAVGIDVALQRLNHPKTHAVGRDVVPQRLNHKNEALPCPNHDVTSRFNQNVVSQRFNQNVISQHSNQNKTNVFCIDKALPQIENNLMDKSRDVAMLRLYRKRQMSKISPPPKSLPVIIRSYKSVCTKIINQKYPNINFAWQTRYYDRVIRNEYELNNIRDYVYYNVKKFYQHKK